MHAALIAREIRRPQLRKGGRVALDDFMFQDPDVRAIEARRRDATRRIVSMLEMMAGPRDVD